MLLQLNYNEDKLLGWCITISLLKPVQRIFCKQGG